MSQIPRLCSEECEMDVIQYGVWTMKQNKKKKKLTKHIGIMVQNGGEIGRIERVYCDRLCGPTLSFGIVNIDRIWVGCVRIKNVDGVKELPHKDLLSEYMIPKEMKAHTWER